MTFPRPSTHTLALAYLQTMQHTPRTLALYGSIAGALLGAFRFFVYPPADPAHATGFILGAAISSALVGAALFYVAAKLWNPIITLAVSPIPDAARAQRVLLLGSRLVLLIAALPLVGTLIQLLAQQPPDTQSILIVLAYSVIMLSLWALLRYRQSRLAAAGLGAIVAAWLVSTLATLNYAYLATEISDAFSTFHFHPGLFYLPLFAIVPLIIIWICVRLFDATSKLRAHKTAG